MFRSYIRMAIRSLLKRKIYTIINVLGLSTGIASFLLIAMFVRDETSYDRFHEKADRIYKVVLERIYPNHSTNYAIIPHSYADVIPEEFSEVRSVVRMVGPFQNTLVRVPISATEEKTFEEDFVIAADSNFFDVFSIKVLKGDAQKALNQLNDVVLTASTAKKYFGDDDPLGKTLTIFNQERVVTAICEDVPPQSHFDFDVLFKFNPDAFGRINFTAFSAHTYVELTSDADPQDIESRFPQLVDRYAAAQIEQNLDKSWEDYKKEGNGYRYFLQPLTSIHLDPTNLEAKQEQGGNIYYIYFLIAIAILVIVIACINFMNLATARSAERAREVGVRKTMGSLRHQLVSQFLIESIVLSMTATMVATAIVYLVLPSFNSLANKQLAFALDGPIVLTLCGIALLVGFLAGCYPAFVLSSMNPVTIMKGRWMTSGTRGSLLRNGLVVFQFFVSIVLIVGTLVVGQQMQFMRNKALGFDKDHVVIVERLFLLGPQSRVFMDEVKRLPEVVDAGRSSALLGVAGFFGSQWQPEGSSEILTTKTLNIDDAFAQTMNFEFAKGRPFSEETNDSLSIIVNEAAVRAMDITDPIGTKLYQVQQTPEGNATVTYTIIGVIKDFNFQSLRDEITPLTIQSMERFGNNGGVFGYVKVKGSDLESTVANLKAVWDKFDANQPFRYSFMDEGLSAQYDNERRAGQIFAVFSVLAIIIACIGLFGLAAYMANLRTKEIGIRKVMGASVRSVVLLLSKDFTKLVGVAFLLSVPPGWYIMNNWLEAFAYRIQLGPGVFLLAGFAALAIALLTVSYQSIRAAMANPVKSLRSE